MFVLVKLFDGPIECGIHAVGRILPKLGKLDSWLVASCMGRINCRMLCIVGVVFGNGCAFILGLGVMLLSRNRSSLLPSCRSVCLMCWHCAIFCCLRCSCGPGGMMVLSLSICCVGLSAL